MSERAATYRVGAVPTAPPVAPRARGLDFPTVAGIAIVVAVALWTGWRKSLWVDEAFTLSSTGTSLLATVRAIVVVGWQAPLYFLLLFFWRRVSDSVAWAPLFSLLCVVTTLPVLAAISRRLRIGGRSWNLALLGALTPHLLYMPPRLAPTRSPCCSALWPPTGSPGAGSCPTTIRAGPSGGSWRPRASRSSRTTTPGSRWPGSSRRSSRSTRTAGAAPWVPRWPSRSSSWRGPRLRPTRCASRSRTTIPSPSEGPRRSNAPPPSRRGRGARRPGGRSSPTRRPPTGRRPSSSYWSARACSLRRGAPAARRPGSAPMPRSCSRRSFRPRCLRACGSVTRLKSLRGTGSSRRPAG